MRPCIKFTVSQHQLCLSITPSLSVVCSCWLSSQNGTHWAFFAPAILVALVSTIGPVTASIVHIICTYSVFTQVWLLYTSIHTFLQYTLLIHATLKYFTNCFVCHLLQYCFLRFYNYMYIMYMQYLHAFYTDCFVFLLRTSYPVILATL